MARPSRRSRIDARRRDTPCSREPTSSRPRHEDDPWRRPVIETPVVFIIHKRPETTRRVFAEIAKARPPRLLIVADGPRPGHEGEARLCAEARAVASGVNWDCEVLRSFSDTKLGLKRRISSGLDWAFSLTETAIILEDDCLPHADFFSFCETLLERYRNNERVMMISGSNFQQGIRRGDGDYYFSRVAHIWGWATWRRAWQHYDVQMTSFPAFVDRRAIELILRDPTMRAHYLDLLRSTRESEIDTWDYQWQFALWNRDGWVAVPNVNLVSNIGFGPEATHTPTPHPLFADAPTLPLTGLAAPSTLACDDEADLAEFRAERAWYQRPLWRRLVGRVARRLRRPRPADRSA
jgi:hypothetical protein